ncbi:hypothetical protein OG474_30500 [Kribbella sp. NBC_01505]|uniref:hypothetical protein n=1 Tax=Kribbella sp. NBC_01505 TaxID=2903580 RepID=UPI0038657789
MPYTEHDVVKAEKIAATAAVSLEERLVVPQVFFREDISRFKGAKDDTVTVTVDGVLPFRSYGWRNDRSQPVKFDDYKERKVAVTFGGDTYNGVRLTDEQKDFDLNGWAKLVSKQTEAVGRGLEYKSTSHLTKAPYELTVGVDASNLRKSLIRVRAVMNRLRVPDGARTILLGTDFEAVLLEDEKLNLASNVGEAEAVTSLREATIGRRYGFNFVVAQELPPDMAVAMVDSAFVFVTGAASVPNSIPFGANASHNGVSLRWMVDYDMEYKVDRSLVDTYDSYREVVDTLVGVDAENQSYISDYEHFVRAFKLSLGETAAEAASLDVLPDPDGDDEKMTELGNITGIWGPSNGTPSTDAANVPATTVKDTEGKAINPVSDNTPTNRRGKARNEA